MRTRVVGSYASISKNERFLSYLDDVCHRIITIARARVSRYVIGIIRYVLVNHLSYHTGGRLFNDTLRRSTKNVSVGSGE